MGGPGSGNRYHWWRSSKRDTVEGCRSLDANRWMREGILKADCHQRGSWAWFADKECKNSKSSIGYEVNTFASPPWVRLNYTITARNEPLNYEIRLTTTRPRFGGLRWWFLCPLTRNGRTCGRRVGKLYLSGRYFGCRKCHDLTYTSCQESHKLDAFARFLARDMGRDAASMKEVIRGLGKRFGDA
jgi:hypothetical protein